MNGSALSTYQDQSYAPSYPTYVHAMPMTSSGDRSHVSSASYEYQHQHVPSNQVSIESTELNPHPTVSVRHIGGQYLAPQPQHHQFYSSPVEEDSPGSSSGPPTPAHDSHYHHGTSQPYQHQPHQPQPSSYTPSELQHAGYSPTFPSHRYQQPSPPPVLAPIRHEQYEQQPHQGSVIQVYRSYHGQTSAPRDNESLDSQWKADMRSKSLGMLVR